MVTIGRVVKPQGRKGEMVVLPTTDRPDRFPSLRRAYVSAPGGAAREVAVESTWPHKGRFVVKLIGVDSIDAAEAYRGQDLRIAPEELEALPAGSYYHHELIGLQAEDESGRPHGRVDDILETGAGAPVLVLRGPAGEEMLPLAEGFVKAIDPTHGRIVIHVPGSVEAP
jgi:16S rRNA processing protein RimM